MAVRKELVLSALEVSAAAARPVPNQSRVLAAADALQRDDGDPRRGLGRLLDLALVVRLGNPAARRRRALRVVRRADQLHQRAGLARRRRRALRAVLAGDAPDRQRDRALSHHHLAGDADVGRFADPGARLRARLDHQRRGDQDRQIARQRDGPVCDPGRVRRRLAALFSDARSTVRQRLLDLDREAAPAPQQRSRQRPGQLAPAFAGDAAEVSQRFGSRAQRAARSGNASPTCRRW